MPRTIYEESIYSESSIDREEFDDRYEQLQDDDRFSSFSDDSMDLESGYYNKRRLKHSNSLDADNRPRWDMLKKARSFGAKSSGSSGSSGSKKKKGRSKRSQSSAPPRRQKRLDALDEKKCRELFNCLDTEGIGMLHKKAIVKMLEQSLKECKLEVQGEAKLETLADLMLKYAHDNSTSKLTKSKGRKYISYDQFQMVYRRYILGDTGGSDTHNRSSMAVILGNNNKDIAKQERAKETFINTNATSMQKWSVWYNNEKLRIWWMFVYVVLNVGSYVWKHDKYCNRQPAAFALSGYGLCIARGMAQVCLLNAALVLLPLCRNLMQFLRNSQFLHEYIPFDDAILFHKITGYNFVFGGLIHTGGQLYAYFFKVQKASDEVWFASSIARSGAFPGPRPSFGDLLKTIPGWTGVGLVLCTMIALPFTFGFFRRNNFNWFWYSHMLFYPVYMGLNWFHGIQSWLEPTQAWAFTTIPILLFVIDRRDKVKLYANTKNVRIRSIDLDTDAVGVVIEKPDDFGDYLPGTYIVLNIPELSSFEWHPFTLTSAPDDDFISVHIRALGDWTNAFHKMMKDYEDGRRRELPMARVDGPVGAPTQDYLNYEVVLMIGAGIGVTPFASILRDTAYRLKQMRCKHCGVVDYNRKMGRGKNLKKLYFHWTTRTQSSLQWFSNCMNEVAKLDVDGKIEIHNHLTNVATDSNNATQVKMAQTFLHQMTGTDLVSGLQTKTRTHFGRPDWEAIFSDLVKRHPKENIGVFFCGARSFEKRLQALCSKYSVNELGVSFDMHAEKF